MNDQLIEKGTILFGRYRIERVIGQGGFGITYYAYHLQLGTYVAIKEFFLSGICYRTPKGTVKYRDFAPEKFEKLRKRFQEEANTLCRLSNPHVVSVRDIFDENGTTYIVMDYVEGETLQKKVERDGALSYDAAVNYMAQLCEAVEHIHSHHILHRDIKPDNIIITPQNNVVLIDFGSARGFVHDKEQKHTAMLTMGYAPIEQYTATSKKGNYTDLYAVGGTFYFILTGQKPIPAADRVVQDELQEPRTLNPSIPMSANQTIMKALRLKPEERYQTIADFQSDLLGGGPSGDQLGGNLPGDGTKTKPQDKNYTWLWILVGFFVAVLVLSVGYVLRQKVQNGKSKQGTGETVEEQAYEVPDPRSMAGYDAELSERELTGLDLQHKSLDDLSIMRNSVYARYGFKFGKEYLFSHFSQFDWYHPVVLDQDVAFAQMNSYEQSNVKFIRNYEKSIRAITSNDLSFFMTGVAAGYYCEISFDGNRREGRFEQYVSEYSSVYRTLRLHKFDGSQLELEAYDTNGKYVSRLCGTIDEYKSSYIGSITSTNNGTVYFEVSSDYSDEPDDYAY